MCGITGAMWTDPKLAIDEPTLARMTDVLRHRGPDEFGEYRSELRIQSPLEPLPGVALGFRRLSIIDLSTGHQPLSNEDGSIWLVFNGEIYNYLALRKRLEGSGHTFRTNSDSETIVHLYEDEGIHCFKHLNGMFAVAIWDSGKRQLILARDRLGKKPLVYRHQPGRLSFASELKSLLQVPGFDRQMDPGAIDAYLTYQYVPHPRTIFQCAAKLPPGHFAVYQDDRLEVKAYWNPNFSHETDISEHDATSRVQELLEDAVRLRMRSDVPLGAFLSGGIDSSLIVALMQRNSSQPIQTFSIGFPIPEYDETGFARLVAQHLGTEHHEFQVDPDCLSVLPKLIWHYDEPFADSSALPTWYVSQLTRQHVTVALTGDGGDELFAGYTRYRAVAFGAWLDGTGPLRSLLASRIWQHLPGSRYRSIARKMKRFSAGLADSPVRRYMEWLAIFNEARRVELYNDDFLARLPDEDPVDFVKTAWNRATFRDPVTCASMADLTTYLPCDLMTKVDIASMAHSLECRAPFLDYRLVEFAASLPIGLKFRHGRGKWLLRRAFENLLPRQIWSRRKMGFGVPLEHWFRNELKPLTQETLLDRKARSAEFLRTDTVKRLFNEHQSGKFDHSYRLWALLILELWMREWT